MGWDHDNATYFDQGTHFDDSHWDGDVSDFYQNDAQMSTQSPRNGQRDTPYISSDNANGSNGKRLYYKTKTRISIKPPTQRQGQSNTDNGHRGRESQLERGGNRSERDVRFEKSVSYAPDNRPPPNSLQRQLAEALRTIETYRYSSER